MLDRPIRASSPCDHHGTGSGVQQTGSTPPCRVQRELVSHPDERRGYEALRRRRDTGVPCGHTTAVTAQRAARLGDGINLITAPWTALEHLIGVYRTSLQQHPTSLGRVIVRVNAAPRPHADTEARPAFHGHPDQIVEDLLRAQTLDIDDVFFDMQRDATPIRDQLQLLDQFRAATGPA